MIFTPKKSNDTQESEFAHTLIRVLQQILEGYALHSVEFDPIEQASFRSSIRQMARSLDGMTDHQDLLILTGGINKTIQGYNELVERFIRNLLIEKQLGTEMLTQSLLKVSHASEKSAQSLRQVEKQLAGASQLQDMRELRTKMADCIAAICLEADVQNTLHGELQKRISELGNPIEPRDKLTGLNTIKAAEIRIKELAESGRPAHVAAFFLKNLDVVNRRFGFAAGDNVLLKFVAYLGTRLQNKDEMFRWRGPCFVVVAETLLPLSAVEANAYQIGVQGPEIEVEGGPKSMLMRLRAATAVFAIQRGQSSSHLSVKIDQFSAEQFKLSPSQ